MIDYEQQIRSARNLVRSSKRELIHLRRSETNLKRLIKEMREKLEREKELLRALDAGRTGEEN